MNNNLYTSIAIVLVGAIAVGAYFYPSYAPLAGTSTAGSTFNSAKMAAVAFAPADPTATTTSILNTDANDRLVTGARVSCGNVGTSFTQINGSGLAALIFSAATTSTNAPATVSNTNFAFRVTVATSSVDTFVASTTPTNSYMQRWSAGSYLTFFSNATNTAQCTVAADYLPS